MRSAARAALVVVLAVSSAACASEEPSTEAVSTASQPTMATTIAPVASSAPSTSRIEPSWSAAPPLLRARSAHGVVVAAGALYAVGGTGEDGKPITEVERFDGAGWIDVTVLPGGGVNAPSVAAVDGRIYVIGGFTGTSSRPTDEVWVYDVASATWSTAAALPTASGGHAATVLDNKIHVIGGGTALDDLRPCRLRPDHRCMGERGSTSAGRGQPGGCCAERAALGHRRPQRPQRLR